MFTGIVTHKAPILTSELRGGILRLTLDTPSGFTENLETGASIAVNGVCLTVVDIVDDIYSDFIGKVNIVSIR